MANIKISDLTAASVAADANEFEINEAGTSKKVTGSQIKAYVNAADGALASKNTVATADIDNDAVTTAKILDANVTSAKIAADAIDGTKIADDAIGNEHIAAGAVGTTELADSSVTTAKISATGTASANTYLSGAGTWGSIAAGAALRTQLFTAPGTWTRPANTNWVKAHVIGGGGGAKSNSPGGTGGTSSFGSFITANGGSGTLTDNNNPSAGGNVSYGGGAVRQMGTGKMQSSPTGNELEQRGPFYGYRNLGSPAYTSLNVSNVPWSETNNYSPGGGGYGNRGGGRGQIGGYGCALCPVTGPVAVTQGAGGNWGGQDSNGGVRGAILVEWVE